MTTGADLGQTLIPTRAGDRDGVLVDRLRAARDSAYSNRWDPGLTKASVDAGDGRVQAATVTFCAVTVQRQIENDWASASFRAHLHR